MEAYDYESERFIFFGCILFVFGEGTAAPSHFLLQEAVRDADKVDPWRETGREGVVSITEPKLHRNLVGYPQDVPAYLVKVVPGVTMKEGRLHAYNTYMARVGKWLAHSSGLEGLMDVHVSVEIKTVWRTFCTRDRAETGLAVFEPLD